MAPQRFPQVLWKVGLKSPHYYWWNVEKSHTGSEDPLHFIYPWVSKCVCGGVWGEGGVRVCVCVCVCVCEKVTQVKKTQKSRTSEKKSRKTHIKDIQEPCVSKGM